MPTIPYDEPAIAAGDVIIRRINPLHHVIFDLNKRCDRISSKAYKPSSGKDEGMSVDVEALIVNSGKNPKDYVSSPVYTGSVYFMASEIRSLQLKLGYDPIDVNPYHGQVWGTLTANRFSKEQIGKLKLVAKWYLKIPEVEIN